jgi:acetylornithine deacetylase
MNDLFAQIRKGIDIPSVTGEEGDFARFVARILEERRYEVELQPVEGDRMNVYARAARVPRVVLCTHLDTVPPFIASSEDDETIFGRGSCDAKGILFSMIEAADRLRARDIQDVGMLFTVGEELDSIGASAACALAPGSEYVIVGEPTENRLASGHKGTFKFRLTVAGRAAHSAYPELGISAIDRLLDVLDVIRRAKWGYSDRLGAATVNIGTIGGGVASNVISPAAEAVVFVRVVGRASEARAVLDGILAGREGIGCEMVAVSDAVHCETPEGYEHAPVAFGTDISSLRGFGKPLLVGPGSIHVAHTAGERIAKREIVMAVELYEGLVMRLLEQRA